MKIRYDAINDRADEYPCYVARVHAHDKYYYRFHCELGPQEMYRSYHADWYLGGARVWDRGDYID